MESEDVLERTLPPLDFAEVVNSLEGRDDLGEVAPRSPTPTVVLPHGRSPPRLAAEMVVSPIGQAASVTSSPRVSTVAELVASTEPCLTPTGVDTMHFSLTAGSGGAWG